jgi:tetratricopeptide (TPR) repeat protein
LDEETASGIRSAASAATARHREVLVEKAEKGAQALARHRDQEAARLLKPVAEEVPEVPGVRELTGLAAYRSGRWREALRHLEAYGELTGSPAHLPEIMDCLRALGRHRKVAEHWTELRHEAPDADLMTEARIVAAGSLADQGDLSGAIALLSTAGMARPLRNPAERHLRQWYVLGDLYERSGDVPRARELFERVARVDPEAYDVPERLAGLGGGPSGRRSRSGAARGAKRDRPPSD